MNRPVGRDGVSRDALGASARLLFGRNLRLAATDQRFETCLLRRGQFFVGCHFDGGAAALFVGEGDEIAAFGGEGCQAVLRTLLRQLLSL